MIDDFAKAICDETSREFSFVVEGADRFRILTPFELDDGDLISVVIRRDENSYVITDDGFILTHLTYDMDEKDFHSGGRKKIIDGTLSSFNVALEGRSIVRRSDERDLHLGILDVIQTALRLSNLSFLTRDRVRTTFVEDFRRIVSREAGDSRMSYDWFDADRDPGKRYKVDARIEATGRRPPLLLFALTNETKTRDATISLLKFKSWHLEHNSVGVFEDMAEISRPVLDRFIEASDKQIVNLSEENRIELASTIQNQIAA